MSSIDRPVEGHAPVTVENGVIRFGGVYVCDTTAGDSPLSLMDALDSAWSIALTQQPRDAA